MAEPPLPDAWLAEELREGRALRIPSAVAEFDLVAPADRLTADPRYGALRILVRAGARPIGWLHLPLDNGVCSPEALGRGIRGLAPNVARCAVRARSSSPSANAPAITIVVCTRDRPESLARCLDSIVALDYPDFEVVLVDNAPSSDATRRVADRYPVRYVREAVPGLDRARNRGVAEARHEIIAFTDDDVRVDSQWLRGIAAGFADPAVGLVTGFVAPASLGSEAERLFELAYGGMGKGFAPRIVDGATALAPRLLSTHHLGVGANMALRRPVLGEIGGFDTALDVGTPAHGGGDLDVFHRVLLTGRRAHYEPSAIVWHHHRESTAGLRRQMYDNGRAFGTYMLVRLRDRRLSRAVVLRELGRWAAWLVGRVPRQLLRREKMPLLYIAAELWGALHAPYAYLRTYALDRRLRHAPPSPEIQT
jgi:glycosyltransferase involved in cell wall biosynthesis